MRDRHHLPQAEILWPSFRRFHARLPCIHDARESDGVGYPWYAQRVSDQHEGGEILAVYGQTEKGNTMPRASKKAIAEAQTQAVKDLAPDLARAKEALAAQAKQSSPLAMRGCTNYVRNKLSVSYFRAMDLVNALVRDGFISDVQPDGSRFLIP